MPDGASTSIRTFSKHVGMTLPTAAMGTRGDVPNTSGKALKTPVILKTRWLHLERRVAGQITYRA